MSFKKFIDYIKEGKKGDTKDIEQVQAESPKVDPSVSLVCPKCGETSKICDCYIDDYYDAKTPQYTPKGKIRKGKKNEKN